MVDMTDQDTTTLSPLQRKELRAQAHHLDPVVLIGDGGLTDNVLAEVRRALAAHHLIKIRVFGDDRDLRLEILSQICEATGAAPVQHIGKLLVVYRAPTPEEEQAAARKRRKPSGPRITKKAAGAGVTKARKPATRKTRAAEPEPEVKHRRVGMVIERPPRPGRAPRAESPAAARTRRRISR